MDVIHYKFSVYEYMCVCVYEYMCVCVYEYMCVCVYELESGESAGASRAVVKGLMDVEVTVDTEWLLAFGTGVCLGGKREEAEGGEKGGEGGREGGRKGRERGEKGGKLR